jgi:hypothetical protein
MINEGKIRPSSSMVGSPILFVPKSNSQNLQLCVHYRHLNDYMKNDKTPLPIMQELQSRLQGAVFIMKIELKSSLHFILRALGHEKFTAVHTQFGRYEYMVMPFGLTNAPATFQREINKILQLLLGIKLVIDTKVHIDEDNRIVVVVYMDDILIATKESIDKHRRQVSNVFQLSMGYNMGVEIDKCIFDAQETSL